MKVYTGTFANMVGQLYKDFLSAARPVDVGQWQGRDIKGDPNKVTWEIREAILQLGMPDSIEGAQRMISPNLPWAEDHFLERVSGKPLNPPPSNGWWPFAQNGHSDHVDSSGQFSHTYPERFWPRHAGEFLTETEECRGHYGIRFRYGDLNDVVNRLRKSPMTRQAYLPVWFPEDTGAPDGERVPCSIGYHFMIREGRLHLSYTIRACDFMRHFRDDVYMAIRLGQWVRDQLEESKQDVEGGLQHQLEMGELTMHIGSFHIFAGDRPMVKHLAHKDQVEASIRLREALG